MYLFYRILIVSNFIMFSSFNLSFLYAGNAVVSVQNGASITLNSDGIHHSYLINIGSDDGIVLVYDGGVFDAWGDDALVDFTVDNNPSQIEIHNNASVGVIKRFVLYPNYPNPFNAQTNIRFDVPTVGNNFKEINLSVYNTLGQKVEVLYNGILPGGEYKTIWDAGVHSSGMFLFVLRSGQFVQVKKIINLK